MQSETGNQSQSLPPQTVQPRAKEIMSGLKDGESPLDFIRNNIRPPETIVPQQVISEVEKKRAEASAPSPVAATAPTPTPAPTETPPTPPVAKAETSITPEDFHTKQEAKAVPAEEPAAPVNDKEENFKNLRKKVHETTEVLKEKEKTVEELQNKVKKYETGEELPEVLKAKEARIAELERYEKLHALKISPAYKEHFIAPLSNLKARLGEIAADYEIPNELMEKALNLTNKRDLNLFLSSHFDDVGALEVKQLISQAQEIKAQAAEAEQEPAQALQAIEEDYKNIQAARRFQSLEKVKEASKEAWVDSLIKIKEENKIPELISRENDVEFNKTYVEPILDAASREYAKIIKVLADNGLETLPKDVAFALARMVHLAHASAVSIEARKKAEAEAESVRQNVARTTRYERPALGGGYGGSAASPGPITKTPAEAADAILNQVLSRRGG